MFGNATYETISQVQRLVANLSEELFYIWCKISVLSNFESSENTFARNLMNEDSLFSSLNDFLQSVVFGKV